MNQSRIKKTRKAAIKLAFASPNLTQQQKEKVYQGAVKTLKKAARHQGIPQKRGLIVSKKARPGESIMDFQERRRVCNKKRREREKLSIIFDDISIES